MKIFLQVLLFPCVIPRKHWENTLVELYSRRKNSRSTPHSAKKISRSSNIRTKKTSLIQDFAHPVIRSFSTSLIQKLSQNISSKSGIAEIRDRRSPDNRSIEAGLCPGGCLAVWEDHQHCVLVNRIWLWLALKTIYMNLFDHRS